VLLLKPAERGIGRSGNAAGRDALNVGRPYLLGSAVYITASGVHKRTHREAAQRLG
jgi:hypothetical protein